ncbi:MAG: hypothetical protein JSU91_00370 [Thermoplasmatales archaeon]|nr:MAG: hypothetical protein JSU91_00370 [Thermoplasmatales archaeon]
MHDNILKKLLIIGIFILFVLASTITSIGVKYNSNQILPFGDPYFILLSDYTDGAGDENLWALQLRFDIDLGVVESEFDNKSLPLITDQWVEIRIYIDLNNDWMEIYYNGELLHQKLWSAGPDNTGQGIVNLSAVNLFSDLRTAVYFDDLTIEEVGGGIIWSDNFDSYEDGSSIHGQGGWKGWDNNSEYSAYIRSLKNRSSPNSLEIKAFSDIVHEYFGNYSGEFVYTAWMFFPENIKPYRPDIKGPESGGVGTKYDYIFDSIDPNGDDVYYYVDWGDGEVVEWIGPYGSGEEVKIDHFWSEKGEYEIRAKARDALDLESEWSDPFYVTISNPPAAPEIDGPPRVRVNKEYEFNFYTVDPDGDDVKYFIDWGDGYYGETYFYPSGSNIKIKHIWSTKGNFTIKAKAIDVYNAESNWSSLEIIVPKAIESYFNLKILSWLYELSPNVFRIIKYLFGL